MGYQLLNKLSIEPTAGQDMHVEQNQSWNLRSSVKRDAFKEAPIFRIISQEAGRIKSHDFVLN